jgi:hypothetical protein
MNKCYIYIGLFLLLTSFVIAQPPWQQPSQQTPTEAGYLIIETGWPEYHKSGEDLYIHTHVHNGTDGLQIIDNINCFYHTYNHQIKGGEHIDIGILTQYGEGFYNYTNGSLLTDVGQYSVLIWCNGTVEGGFTKYTFEVTHTGRETPSELLLLFFMLTFIGLFFFGIIYFFKALKEFTLLEMDLFDTIILMCSYFAMWIFYYFQMNYLGDPLMNEFLVLAISIGSITHVLLPLIGLFTSFILTTLKFKQKQRVTY